MRGVRGSTRRRKNDRLLRTQMLRLRRTQMSPRPSKLRTMSNLNSAHAEISPSLTTQTRVMLL
jgi:hypothetical protein